MIPEYDVFLEDWVMAPEVIMREHLLSLRCLPGGVSLICLSVVVVLQITAKILGL